MSMHYNKIYITVMTKGVRKTKIKHNQIFPQQFPKNARNLEIKETDSMILNLDGEHIDDLTFCCQYAKYNVVKFITS